MKQLLALCSVMSLCGCMNVCYTVTRLREPYDNSWGVYEPTRSAAECIEAGAKAIAGEPSTHDPIADAWCGILLPFLIIDLPCEVVLDTVFLPWDTCWQLVRQNEDNS